MNFSKYFCFFSLILRIHPEVSNFFDKLSCEMWNVDWWRSFFLYIFLQVGKIKVTAKRGLKILWSFCQNSPSIMKNGIRKVRKGVNIFDKRIPESCKLISDSASALSTAIIYSAGSISIILDGAQPIRILLYIYVSIFLVSGKSEGRGREA